MTDDISARIRLTPTLRGAPEIGSMRALHAYAKSDPTRLVYERAPSPALGAGDVLVRVHASGVSPGELDWPTAWLNHDGTPRTAPIVPGHEVAGVVWRGRVGGRRRRGWRRGLRVHRHPT